MSRREMPARFALEKESMESLLKLPPWFDPVPWIFRVREELEIPLARAELQYRIEEARIRIQMYERLEKELARNI